MAEKGAVALMQRLFFNSNVIIIIDFYPYLSRMLNCRELYNQKSSVNTELHSVAETGFEPATPRV